ncbi:MAG: ABC transporter ATP-binding protein/permease [Firmicutes bacterium]|nr:ABC transporter ATP-binding protein/permease [Bacillota bacterium]
MIRLEHVTKYFNKNKINQFIVCRDINLTFEETGLVVILGASGSGKTTLLNVISGMDKFDQGKLIFDDVVFERYNHRKWDNIRKHKIGFVYQHYHLLKEQTVYRNIEPVLKMQGITEANDIREHVLRLLKTVGMASYADRLVKQLSGGQQQRIAFARALANNPEVILADEPTGNLDGKTTIELMRVIKEISKTRLVIMVTHEQVLCDNYADRVIEIENGSIVKDFLNDSEHKMDFIQEHIINLSDFKKTTIEADQLNVRRFTNNEKNESLDIDLIERNQTLYVKINSGNLKRTKYVDSDSEILIQENPSVSQTSTNPFVMDDLIPKNLPKSERNVFSWKDTLLYAFRKIKVFHGGGKMLFFVLILVGLIVSISVGLVGEIYHVEEPYSVIDSNYITVTMDRTTYDQVLEIESVEGVDQLVLVSEPYQFVISTGKYYEVRNSIHIDAQPIDIKFFDENDLIYGVMPTGYEIIVDKTVADAIINNNAYRAIQNYEDVLNCQFKLQVSGLDTNLSAESALYFNISGIADANSLSVWMKEELMYSFVAPSLVDYRIFEDHFEIISGELPESDNYILLNDQYPSVLEGNIPYNIGMTSGTYYISGIYQVKVDDIIFDTHNAMVTTVDFIKSKYFTYEFSRDFSFSILVYSTDVESTLLALNEAGYSASANTYEPTIAQQIKLDANQNFYLLGLGGIVMSAFSIFLIMRSSLISRMYEVSVYRSIGISRKEIRRIFFVEIILTTTFSSIIGFVFMLLLLNQAQSSLQQISVTHYTTASILFGVLGLYLINVVFGLIPINMLLRKTPSNIIKQSDL